MSLPPLYCNGTNVVANCGECQFSWRRLLWELCLIRLFVFPISCSLFLVVFTSKASWLLLFQPIRHSASHILRCYRSSYLIVNCVLQHSNTGWCCAGCSPLSGSADQPQVMALALYCALWESWICAVGKITSWKKKLKYAFLPLSLYTGAHNVVLWPVWAER